jgi:hypothetical protein
MKKTIKVSLNDVKSYIKEEYENQKYLKMSPVQKKKYLLEQVENIFNILSENQDLISDDPDLARLYDLTRPTPVKKFDTRTQKATEKITPVQVKKDVKSEIQTVLQVLETATDLNGAVNAQKANISSIIKSISCLLIYMASMKAVSVFLFLRSFAKLIVSNETNGKAVVEKLKTLLEIIADLNGKYDDVGRQLNSISG